MVSRQELELNPQPHGLEVLELLMREGRRWKKMEELYRSGPVLVVDLRSGVKAVFSKGRWQREEGDEVGEIGRKRVMGALVVCSGLTRSGEAVMETNLGGVVSLLPREGKIYILEERGGDDGEEWREEMMKRAEIVERRINKRVLEEFLVLTGRREKRRKGREPVDLLREGSWWRKKMVSDGYAVVRAGYGDRGFEVESTGAIDEVCRSSRNVKGDMDRLWLGFGVRLKSNCECGRCIWEVDREGIWILHQGEEGCTGEPLVIPTRSKLDEVLQIIEERKLRRRAGGLRKGKESSGNSISGGPNSAYPRAGEPANWENLRRVGRIFGGEEK